MTIEVFLSPEFKIACDLLYLKPEELIQAFIENVSLPYYCSTDQFLSAASEESQEEYEAEASPNNEVENQLKILSTNFAITYNGLFNERTPPAEKLQNKYTEQFIDLLPDLMKEPNRQFRYYSLISFYAKWHKDLIKNVSEKDAIINK